MIKFKTSEKPLIILLAPIAFMISSCNQKNTEEAKSSASSSFEFSLEPPYDTINKVYNGLKQGKWVIKQNGKNETVYYKNDTLIK